MPIDRYYIERFLGTHAQGIGGRVLEIAEDTYTRQFGRDRVVRSDVLNAVEGDPRATLVGDLADGDHLPSDTFDCVILTPICPHALTQKPIVVPGDQTIKVELKRHVEDVWVTIDGQVGQPLKLGDRIEVERSPNRVHLVKNPGLDYFAILRQKLRWGER